MKCGLPSTIPDLLATVRECNNRIAERVRREYNPNHIYDASEDMIQIIDECRCLIDIINERKLALKDIPVFTQVSVQLSMPGNHTNKSQYMVSVTHAPVIDNKVLESSSYFPKDSGRFLKCAYFGADRGMAFGYARDCFDRFATDFGGEIYVVHPIIPTEDEKSYLMEDGRKMRCSNEQSY